VGLRACGGDVHPSPESERDSLSLLLLLLGCGCGSDADAAATRHRRSGRGGVRTRWMPLLLPPTDEGRAPRVKKDARRQRSHLGRRDVM
jgi:hypothetical protein